MRRDAPHSRTVALIGLGAFALHQLHYAMVSGSGAGAELRSEGYSYLGHVPLALAALAATVIVGRLLLTYFGAPERAPRPVRAPLQRAVGFTVAIFAVYVAQETLEAALFAHHTENALAALAQGWWLVLALSALLAPIFFALDRWLGRLEDLVAEIAHRPALPASPEDERTPRSAPEGAIALSPLAFGLARRPPPLALPRH